MSGGGRPESNVGVESRLVTGTANDCKLEDISAQRTSASGRFLPDGL